MKNKILIVEDDQALSQALSDKIKSGGFEVILAMDGNEALAKFEKSKPDLVLLDIVMPFRSGFDVLEDIKIRQGSKVPVIILSNLDQPQDIETGKNLGATDYITKSNLTLREIMIKINKALNIVLNASTK